MAVAARSKGSTKKLSQRATTPDNSGGGHYKDDHCGHKKEKEIQIHVRRNHDNSRFLACCSGRRGCVRVKCMYAKLPTHRTHTRRARGLPAQLRGRRRELQAREMGRLWQLLAVNSGMSHTHTHTQSLTSPEGGTKKGPATHTPRSQVVRQGERAREMGAVVPVLTSPQGPD